MTRDYARKRHVRRSPPLPPWLWIMTGLLIGLFVAFLMYLNEQHAQRTPAAKAEKPGTTETVAKKDDGRLRFDFYRILPEYEVVIPQEDLKQPETSAPITPGKFIVQAGSFSTAADADTRRAQLALLGLVSRVQTVTVDGKDTWHRVQLGPYEQVAQLDKARNLLQDNDIEFIVLKVKE